MNEANADTGDTCICRTHGASADGPYPEAVIIDHATITQMDSDSFPHPSFGNVEWKTLLSKPITMTDSICAGIATCPVGGYLALHQHSQAEIYYVLAGSGVVEVDGVRNSVSAGSMLWIPGDAIHGVFCGQDQSLRWLYAFPETRFEDIIYRFKSGKPVEDASSTVS